MILSGIIIISIIVIVIKILLLTIYLVSYNLNIAQYFALTLVRTLNTWTWKCLKLRDIFQYFLCKFT